MHAIVGTPLPGLNRFTERRMNRAASRSDAVCGDQSKIGATMHTKTSLSSTPFAARSVPTPGPVPPGRRRLIPFVGIVALVLIAASIASLLFTRTTDALELPRKFNPADIHVVGDSYSIQVAITNLTAPTAAIFDDRDLLVAESSPVARILRIKEDGTVSTVVSRGLRAPVSGLALRDGRLYVSHKGKVSVAEADGKLSDIITGLPSEGENQNNQIAFGPDGKLYVGQGTITNAGVVGLDDYALGWLDLNPDLHEVPCRDVRLLGQNYQTLNPFLREGDSLVLTGAYKAFGEPTIIDESIRGNLPCGGSILRFNRDGSKGELVAWGLRNPVGLEFDQTGQLWVASQGAEARGSRAILNDPDYFVRIEPGAWYGWPDYFDGRPVADERFRMPGKAPAGFVWATHPALSEAFLTFAPHSAASGFAFSPGGAFGFRGDAFVAMAGPLDTENESDAAGFRIVRVDLLNRMVYDFAANIQAGPAYKSGREGFDHPTDALFGPDGNLYVVDAGAVAKGQAKFQPGTGAIWRISAVNGRTWRGGRTLAVPPSSSTLQSKRSSDISVTLYSMMASMPVFIVLIPGGLIVAVVVIRLAWQLIRAR